METSNFAFEQICFLGLFPKPGKYLSGWNIGKDRAK